MPATHPIYDVNVLTQPAGGSNVTIANPVDGSGNVRVDVAAATATVTVQGGQADGAAPVGNPVLVAGFDGTNAQDVSTDATGKLNVNISNTPAVTFSGTQNVNVTGTPQVMGTIAAGGLTADNPVQIGGSDGTHIQRLSVDTTGKPNVNVTNTPNVSVTNTPTVTVGTITPPAAVVSGQTTIAVTNTAVQLAAHALTAGIVAIRALPGNAGNVFVGPSGVTSSTGIPLKPDDPLIAYVSNTNALFVVGAGVGDGVGYLAS